MLYSFHRTYTQICIIFGLAHNFLHKFKYQAFLTRKGKRKQKTAGRGPAKKARRPAHFRSAHSDAARCPSLCAVTDERVPPVSSAFLAHGGPAAIPAAAGEVQAHTRVRISSASTLRLHSYCSRTLYRSLSTSTAYMADGCVGCPKTGHEGSVEHN